MAVRIRLSADELSGALAPFGVGPVREAIGLPEGSINTNHRLVTPAGTFLARLTELRSEADLEFEASLLVELRAGGLPVVAPLRTPGAAALPFVQLGSGLLSLFPWVAGEPERDQLPSASRRMELGRILGRLHRLTRGSELRRPNPYGPERVRGWLTELEATDGRGDPDVAAALPLLRRGLEAGDLSGLSEGVIHGDAFRDNVLWLGDRIAALLDFEMAGDAPWELDLAVALLDWAFDAAAPEGQRFAPAGPLLAGYRTARAPDPPPDPGALARCLAFAATRFTLSRLRDFHFSPLPESALVRKDWREMRARLEEALRLDGRTFEATARSPS